MIGIIDFKKSSGEKVPNLEEYVKEYVNDWLDTIVDARFDKFTMLQLFEAEELRTKTLQVIKKLRADLL